MKLGGLEIIYKTTGYEEFNFWSRVRIGWAFRHWYFILTFRVILGDIREQQSFYRNFAIGWSRERKKIVFGINR